MPDAAAGDPITALMFTPVEQDFDDTSISANSTTFIAGNPEVGTTFVANEFGKALVTVWARAQTSGASNTVLYVSPQVFLGSDNSGTEVFAPSQTDSSATFAGTGGPFVHNDVTVPVEGLTPGTTYFARVAHSAVNTPNNTIGRRRIIVRGTS